jgi:hypothetical protein
MVLGEFPSMIFLSRGDACIPNQQELIEKMRQSGGRVFMFYRVWSLLVFASTKPVFIWVSPGKAGWRAGAGASMSSMVLGWWSIPGLIMTPFCLLYNFVGGMEVTELFQTPPPIPGSPAAQALSCRSKSTRMRVWLALAAAAIVITIPLSAAIGRAAKSDEGAARVRKAKSKMSHSATASPVDPISDR